MRQLSSQEIVLELLRTYRDVVDTLNGASDWIGRGPGSRYLDRPPHHPYHTGSYKTLETILMEMRTREPTMYAAVADTYLRSARRIIEVKITRKAKNNKTVTLIERAQSRSYPWTHRLLDRGVTWITREFQQKRLAHFLPREVYEAVCAYDSVRSSN